MKLLAHKNSIRLTLLFAAIFLSLLFLAWVSYQNRFILNADGIAYISIAEHYAAGNWQAAVNAYWSPLLSWLMTLLLFLGISGQVAFVIINFLAASFILLFGSWLCWRLTRRWSVAGLYFLCIYPFLVYLMTTQITPDILVIAWMVAAIGVFHFISQKILASKSYRQLLLLAIILAAFGFLGYITKLYLQPVFLAALFALTGIVIWQWYKKTNRRTSITHGLRFLLTSLAAYGVFCLMWCIPLSIKYHEPTLGSSYSFNTNSGTLPQTYLLLDPPHNQATTAWEDPTYLTDIKQASAEQTQPNASIFTKIKKSYHTLPLYLEKIGDLWIFLFMPVIVGVAYLLFRKKQTPYGTSIMYCLVLFGIYIGGYTIHGGVGNHRYQWPLLVLSIFILSLLSTVLWEKATRRSTQRFWLVLLLLVFPASLFITYTQYPHHNFHRSDMPSLQRAANEIAKDNIIPEGSSIAASDFRTATHLAYYLNTRSYGTTASQLTGNDDAREKLLTHDIEYFIDIKNPDQKNMYSKKDQLIFSYNLDSYCDGACELNVIKIAK